MHQLGISFTIKRQGTIVWVLRYIYEMIDFKMLVTFQFSFWVLMFWGGWKRILQQDRVKGRREWESHDTIRVPPPPMSSGMLYPLLHSSITEYVVLSSRFPSLCPSSSHSPVLLYLPREDNLHPYLSYIIFSHSFFQKSYLSTDLQIQAESSQGSFRPNDPPIPIFHSHYVQSLGYQWIFLPLSLCLCCDLFLECSSPLSCPLWEDRLRLVQTENHYDYSCFNHSCVGPVVVCLPYGSSLSSTDCKCSRRTMQVANLCPLASNAGLVT